MIIAIALATFVSTLLGGLFALRFKDKLHLILGFSAGAVIGVAFFDILPEAINLVGNSLTPATITTFTALGFTVYMILDRVFTIHFHENEESDRHRGVLGAASLSFHSFLDGVAIGVAFQVSSAVGIIVAIAVLVHDFSDGINTVNVILKNKGERTQGMKWLIADALAPVLGVTTTFFFTLPQTAVGLMLGLFAGFFIYIGASDLLPESHHRHPTMWTTVMTVIGIGVLFVAIRITNL